MKKKYNYLHILYLILLLFIILIISNYYFKKNIENFSLNDKMFSKVLNNNNMYIKKEDDEYIIYKKIDDNNQIEIAKYYDKNLNSKDSHYIAKNKNLTSKIYQENNIPVPKYFLITKDNVEYFYKNQPLNYPCVLKPTDGSFGRGVNTNIKNKKEFINILDNLINKYDNIMYEEQIEGRNYRVFVFQEQVLDVIEKERPYVIGDGINTIQYLINKTNVEKVQNKLFGTIMKDSDWEYIKSQGEYYPDSILENNKKIFITTVLNLHNGAIPVRIPVSEIPVENIELFKKACKNINAISGGIDYVSPDIKIPYYENNGRILEFNSKAGVIIHRNADKNNKYFLYDKINNIYNGN